jgi:hypothetical protein
MAVTKIPTITTTGIKILMSIARAPYKSDARMGGG